MLSLSYNLVNPIAFQLSGSKVRKQIVLDGPVSCGKSIALAMLVHWARDQGWLVFYVPKGREWTHGGFFYKNPLTGFWDTPVQAANALQARMISVLIIGLFFCHQAHYN